MPTPAQVDSLAELLATRAPIVVIETHDERRVSALFGLVAQRGGREVWQWSASRGLRVAHNLKLELADLGTGLAQHLVHQILKHHLLALVGCRSDVGQIVRYRVHR